MIRKPSTRRDQRVLVLLNKTEKLRLNKRASMRDVTMSELIRKILFSK